MRGKRVGQAVDRRRRCGDDLLDAGGLCCFEHVEAAVAHHAERLAWLGGAGGDAQGRHVDHGVHALRRPGDGRDVADVLAQQRHARILQGLGHVRERAPVQVVHDHDLLGRVLLQQQVDRGRTHETAATRHQNPRTIDLHVFSRLRPALAEQSKLRQQSSRVAGNRHVRRDDCADIDQRAMRMTLFTTLLLDADVPFDSAESGAVSSQGYRMRHATAPGAALQPKDTTPLDCLELRPHALECAAPPPET